MDKTKATMGFDAGMLGEMIGELKFG